MTKKSKLLKNSFFSFSGNSKKKTIIPNKKKETKDSEYFIHTILYLENFITSWVI